MFLHLITYLTANIKLLATHFFKSSSKGVHGPPYTKSIFKFMYLYIIIIIIIIITYIIIIKRGRHWKADRVIYTLSVQRPQFHTTIPTSSIDKKKRRGKTVEDKEGSRWSGQWKSIISTLETRQSHTIEYWVCKIVPHGHWDDIIKVLRYGEVRQRGGEWVYRCAT